MADFYEEIKDWAVGVQASIELDHVPPSAMTQGWNTAFRFFGNGQAVVGRRPGFGSATLPLPGVARTLVPYSLQGVGYVSYLALVTTDGELYFRNVNGVVSSELVPPANYPSPSGVAFSTPERYPQGVVLNGRLFLISGAQAGETGADEKRSLVDQTYVPFGLNPIAAISVSAAAGGSASMPAETYDLAITSYNSVSGGESSRSGIFSITLTAGQRIRVQITPSAAESAQYDTWRIYLRRNTTQALLYQVQQIENNAGATVTSDGNIPIASTDVYVDLSSSTIANHIIPSPDADENDLDVENPIGIAVYGRRLFLATTNKIYWSKIDKGDNFPPENYEPIETGDGDEIVAIKPFRDDLLLIFTKTAVWGLFGSDPQSWTLQLIDGSIGCLGPMSLVQADGRMFWWSIPVGPVAFDGRSIQKLGTDSLGLETRIASLSTPVGFDPINQVHAGYDPEGMRILFAVVDPEELSTTVGRWNIIIPYNYHIGQWEATKWDPLEVSCMATGPNSDGQLKLYVAGFSARLYDLSLDDMDGGVDSGPYPFVVDNGPPLTTIDVGSALFTTDRLVGLKVIITDTSGQYVATDFVASNTTQVITLDGGIPGLTGGATYYCYVGTPHVRVYSKWFDADQAFLRKRFDRLYTHFRTTSERALVNVHVQMDLQPDSITTFTNVGQVAADSSDWEGSTSEGSYVKKRFFIGKSGTAMRIIMEALPANGDFILAKLAHMGRTLSDRYYYD